MFDAGYIEPTGALIGVRGLSLHDVTSPFIS